MARQDKLTGVFSAWATAWGPIGAVSGEKGLRRIVLPYYQMEPLLQLLAWEHPACVRDDKAFEALIALTRDYFNAKAADFSQVLCDIPHESTFSGKVLRAVREIPQGQTRTYSALALQVGLPDAARAVGTAVGKNPVPLVIPCHRVIHVGGSVNGFSAPGGVELKKRMLELEKTNRKA